MQYFSSRDWFILQNLSFAIFIFNYIVQSNTTFFHLKTA